MTTGKSVGLSYSPTLIPQLEEDFLLHLQVVVAIDPKITRWHTVCDQFNAHQSESLVSRKYVLGQLSAPGTRAEILLVPGCFCDDIVTFLVFTGSAFRL
ncbi:MAG TPA: hypothetical protein VF844_02700 [Ktedonobacteraceae bacterium]